MVLSSSGFPIRQACRGLSSCLGRLADCLGRLADCRGRLADCRGRLAPSRAMVVTAAGALAATVAVVPASAADWPSRVDAHYRITFNGFDIGGFDFKAKVGARGYTLDGNAEISALLGAVNWQGMTRSTGQVRRKTPAPNSYVFNFRSNGKGGNIRLGFEKGKVSAISQNPRLPVKDGEIPLQRSHLKGVLDPLSAVMAMTRPTSQSPCDQRLKVFDGKQRFDLALSYKRQEAVGALRTAGQPGIAVVCAVRYQPISGYKPTSETYRLSQGQALEVALRPVPRANLYVPHAIRISTMAGPVALTAQRIDIMTNDRRRIALVSR